MAGSHRIARSWFGALFVLSALAALAVPLGLGPPGSAVGGDTGVLTVRARGSLGEERMEVRAGGAVLGTFTVGTGWSDYQVMTPSAASATDVQVAFINDRSKPLDRNLWVDSISFGGRTYETEDPSTYGTGVWVRGARCRPGYYEAQALACNGYFGYGDLIGPADGTASGSTEIAVAAAGNVGSELIELRVGGQEVASFELRASPDLRNDPDFHEYRYTHPTAVRAGDVSVAFVNDRYKPGYDRNVRLSSITIGGATVAGTSLELELSARADVGVCRPRWDAYRILSCNGVAHIADAAAVGTADEAAVGTADEAAVGTADEAAVGTADEAAVGTAGEAAVGTADEAAVGTADEAAAVESPAVTPAESGLVEDADGLESRPPSDDAQTDAGDSGQLNPVQSESVNDGGGNKAGVVEERFHEPVLIPDGLPAEFGPRTATGRFYVVGDDIVDPTGNVFYPIGANVAIKFTPYGYVFEGGNGGVGNHIDDVITWNWNIVRVTLICDNTSGVPSFQQLVDGIDPALQRLTDAGIVAMLECHDLTGTDPTVGSADERRIRGFWDEMASRYHDNPYVWFNIFNEPYASENTTAWAALHEFYVDRIRATGAENIIVADLPNWGQGIDLLGSSGFADDLNRRCNTVFGWHAYGAIARQQGSFADHERAIQAAKAKEMALIIGELGVATPVNWGNAGPWQWNLSGFDAAEQLGPRHGIGLLWWHATGDTAYYSLYALKNDRSGFWTADNSGNLTPYGQRFWDLSQRVSHSGGSFTGDLAASNCASASS